MAPNDSWLEPQIQKTAPLIVCLIRIVAICIEYSIIVHNMINAKRKNEENEKNETPLDLPFLYKC
jgi:hypothetical protein